jgi:uncharacterized protein YeaO (DUF488 family)
MITVERFYNPPTSNDLSILVDRLWQRGLAKDKAKFDCWIKEDRSEQ